ncbi:hypothetical protein EJ06DRAFT_458939, partial [Trichodelitschia bisporula]
LSRWSDAVFQVWQKLQGGGNGRINAPQYVLRVDITNPETKSAVSRALKMTACQPPLTKEEKEKWPTWPGVTYSTQHSKGQGILGTPNLRGVAWLLI